MFEAGGRTQRFGLSLIIEGFSAEREALPSNLGSGSQMSYPLTQGLLSQSTLLSASYKASGEGPLAAYTLLHGICKVARGMRVRTFDINILECYYSPTPLTQPTNDQPCCPRKETLPQRD